MATKEEISMVGFEIVAYAGDAQTDLLAALDAAREGDFEKAEQLHKDASDALIGAHDTQTKLLSQEAGGGEMEMTFIMAHAQDTLMTTMILEKQTRFTIDAYKRIAALEQNVADTRKLMSEAGGSYLEVIQAQSSLLNVQLSKVADDFYKMQAVVNLYYALGGGAK